MKKFSIFLPVLVASFFLLLPNVRAEEYTYTIPDNVISFMEDNLSIMKSTVENYINNNSDIYDNVYIVDYFSGNSNLKYSVFIFKKNYNINNIFLRYNSNWGFMLWESNQCDWVKLSNDFSSISYYNSCDNFIAGVYTNHYFIFSNIDLYYENSNNTFIYNFKDIQFSEPISNNLKFSTIYDMYDVYYGEPPDNTPILTTFYSTVGSKIGWLGEQIMDSYVYIAIFGVFIFIFIIEFIRRYFL